MTNKNNELLDVTPYFLNIDLRKEHRVFKKNINGKNYYFKGGAFLYNELLACEIYKLLNVPVLDQRLVKIDNKFYLMSEDFKKDNYIYYDGFQLFDEYKKNFNDDEINKLGLRPLEDSQGEEYFFPYNSLDTINSMLISKNINEKDISLIIDTFIKYYSMSIILLDHDFHPGNWVIEFNGNRARVIPKFDNEQIFCSSLSKPSFIVDPSEINPTFLSSIKYFLSNSDIYNINIFKDLFYICDENLIIKANDILNNKYGILLDEYLAKQEYKYSKKSDLRRFSKNHDEICSIIFDMEIMRR